MSFPVVLVVIGVVLLLWFILTFNGFIRLKNSAAEAWSGIDVQLKRRHDLIPNLVEIVKGYVKHERETLEKVVAARTASINAKDLRAQADAEKQVAGALTSIFALAESYPNLKANEQFLSLQKELIEIEDQLQLARRYYNGTVREFNVKSESFPSLLIARLCNFKSKEYFGIDSPERENVKVSMQ